MLVVLSGVSGAGKDTIKKALIARMDNVESLPSYTDRLPREYNVHHEHYYGTSRKLMNEKIKSGKVIVKDIDVNGTANLIKLLGNDTRVVTIFLKVPKEVLAKRLEKRMEKPDYKEITLRLNRFDYEESKMGMYDYVIKNNDLEKSINVIMEIIKSELKIENPEF